MKSKSTETKPSIVFCHGIWADGSCFNKVIPALQEDGHQVIAAQYGLDAFAGDVAAVKRTLGRVSGPAILVGHSYGGSVITAAGTDDRVAALVYIAALAPDADETTQSLTRPRVLFTLSTSPTGESSPCCEAITSNPSFWRVGISLLKHEASAHNP